MRDSARGTPAFTCSVVFTCQLHHRGQGRIVCHVSCSLHGRDHDYYSGISVKDESWNLALEPNAMVRSLREPRLEPSPTPASIPSRFKRAL